MFACVCVCVCVCGCVSTEEHWVDRIGTESWFENLFFSRTKFYKSITDNTEPQNALLLIVVQKQSFPREPILFYSTGLMNNSKKDPSPSTGHLSRPLKASRGLWGGYN